MGTVSPQNLIYLLIIRINLKSFDDAARVVADAVRYKVTAEPQVNMHVHTIRCMISIKTHSLHSTLAYKR